MNFRICDDIFSLGNLYSFVRIVPRAPCVLGNHFHEVDFDYEILWMELEEPSFRYDDDVKDPFLLLSKPQLVPHLSKILPQMVLFS